MTPNLEVETDTRIDMGPQSGQRPRQPTKWAPVAGALTIDNLCARRSRGRGLSNVDVGNIGGLTDVLIGIIET